jgi:hypothetical protein
MLARNESETSRFNFAARCVLSRDLNDDEMATLQSFYKQARHEPGLPAPAELSAYTAVAGVLFNLDAALTR